MKLFNMCLAASAHLGMMPVVVAAFLLGGRALDTPHSSSPRGSLVQNAPLLQVVSEHPWEGQFARVAGRILEHDDSPAAGLRVELLAFGMDLGWSAEHRVVAESELVVSQAVTDEDGRFELGRTRPSNLHVISIDGGGSRSSAWFIDQSLAYGAATDIGIIRLAPTGTVTGSVIDEKGDPVSGARVRLGPVPELFAGAGLLDARPDCRFALTSDGVVDVVNFNAPIATITERAPLPTTLTDEDGSFTLAGVPIGVVSGGVDAAGFASTVVATFELGENEYFLGEIELLNGREVEVTVVDGQGELVRDSQVYVGARHPVFPFSVLQPARATEKAGVYVARGIAEDGDLLALARRSQLHEWTQADPVQLDGEPRIALPPTAPLRLDVVNSDGESLGGAEFRLRPDPAATPQSATRSVDVAFGASRPWIDLTDTKNGGYVCEALPHGDWDIEARRTGYAPQRVHVAHSGGDSRAKITLAKGETLRFRVSESVADVVEGIHVRALRRDGARYEPLGSAWTDEEGRASIGPLLEPGVAVDRVGASDPSISYVVSLEHPEIGTGYWELWPGDSSGERERVLELLDTATWVEGHVRWRGEAPGRRYMLSFDRIQPDLGDTLAPRVASTDENGAFRVGSIDPGTYDVKLAERYLFGNVLDLLSGPGRGETIARATLDVGYGVTGHTVSGTIDFHLSEEGAALPGWFEGRILENGAPLIGATLVFDGRAETAVTTGADGRYRSKAFPAHRRTMIAVYRGAVPAQVAPGECALYLTHAYPRSGAATPLDISLDIRSIVIEVKGRESGQPIPGAMVECSPPNRLLDQFTDEEGRLDTSLVVESDRLELVVGAPEYRIKKLARSLLDPSKPLIAVINLDRE